MNKVSHKIVQEELINLDSHISVLKGIGPRYQFILKRIGVKNVRDLIWLFPKEYILIEVKDTIKEAKATRIIISSVIVINKARKMTKIAAKTMAGESINLIFFSHSKLFYKGSKITIYKKEGFSELDIAHPEWIPGHQDNFVRLTYPVEGIPSVILNQVALRCIDCLSSYLNNIKTSLKLIHEKCDPEAHFDLVKAEALAYQASMERANQWMNSISNNYAFQIDEQSNELIYSKYILTDCQKRVWAEIKGDLMNKPRMTRVLYGDVGSGKTLIAALALNLCYKNGFQGALLAPTEILARQHYAFLQQAFPDLPIVLFTSSSKSKKILNCIKNEDCIIVGTHALIQESIEYKSLRLFIIDEQHRFGVLQRSKAAMCHILLMTATPIPRTLQLATTGVIPISKILKRPQGHRDLRIYTKHKKNIDEVINKIEEIISQGENIFWVCPFIQESPNGMNVISRYELLNQRFANLVGMLHGTMSSSLKEEVLNKFYNKETRILVSTTIIEVGVNIPHANMIVIENVELFGIAQLYQLMGRVGRGSRHGECFFVYDKLTTDARLRLQALKNCTSGLELAEQDLYIRGFGELLGTQQSGKEVFKCIRPKDYSLFDSAYQELTNNLDNQEFNNYIIELEKLFNYLESPWEGA